MQNFSIMEKLMNSLGFQLTKNQLKILYYLIKFILFIWKYASICHKRLKIVFQTKVQRKTKHNLAGFSDFHISEKDLSKM